MTEIPTAQVIRVHGGFATILCPLCGETHEHMKIRRGATEHRSAACGLYTPIPREARSRGYRFHIPLT